MKKYLLIKAAQANGHCCELVTNSNGNKPRICKNKPVTGQDARGRQYCQKHINEFWSQEDLDDWNNLINKGV